MTDIKKKVYVTSSFKRDYKNLSKRHTDLSSLNEVFEALLSNDRDVLDTKYRDHALVGQSTTATTSVAACPYPVVPTNGFDCSPTFG